MFPSVYLSVQNSESVTAIDRLMIKHLVDLHIVYAIALLQSKEILNFLTVGLGSHKR
jgi:hypothetical protein